ncbi:LLM class flavin-dependent oxidoreductase [Geminicoccaceae bacterium 1502E]|nr:LLM class flavin-dependent oxidoreductase [Geminicoccaceae bacterium 1502E]
MTALSVLDLSYVTTATPPSAAIANTIDLAAHVDRLGYTRYWVAEHHNLPSVASGAPEVMIGRIAAATRHLRVGSGGVMLPNHAPLMVAERFKVLEALFPGRIDLGIGRAPGTDPLATMALRRQDAADDFLERLKELLAYQTGTFPQGHPFARIRVMPEDTPVPPVWILGSSDYGARLAGQLGMGYAFAQHFASLDAGLAMEAYHAAFRPQGPGARPHAILATAAVCAESEEEAERLASTADLAFVRRRRGSYEPLPSPEEAMAHAWTGEEEAARRANRKRLFVGTPDALARRLGDSVRTVRAAELMITSPIFDHEARKRSYSLIAEAFGLTPPAS